MDTRPTRNDSQMEEECKQRIDKIAAEGSSWLLTWCQQFNLKYFRECNKLINDLDLDWNPKERSDW